MASVTAVPPRAQDRARGRAETALRLAAPALLGYAVVTIVLLAAFALLIPLARVLSRTYSRTIAYTLSTAALASAAYGIHVSLIWNGPP